MKVDFHSAQLTRLLYKKSEYLKDKSSFLKFCKWDKKINGNVQ